jgi:arylsulfatase A-like enzyme
MNQKTNFIFILIDDLGWKDLSGYGSPFYETPHLDQLAKEGMKFTNAYSSCPVCSPTRASILTGKYPATLGLTNFIAQRVARGKLIDAPYIKYLSLEETTIATILKENGYRTFHVGKWHLGEEPYFPEKHGFEVNLGGCHWGEPREGHFSPYNIPNFENGPEGEYLADRLTNDAIQLMEKSEDPFFLNLCYYAVHTPIQAKKEDIAKYEAKAQKLGLDKIQPFVEGDFYPCEHKKDLRIKRRLLQSDPVYAGMVDNLDQNIGRLISALKKMGKSENTVIFFTSDNGGLATAEGSPTCNAPLQEGKGWMYEGGTRVPLIVKWPGVTSPGKVCDIPVTSTDFLSTILDMAGIADKTPEDVEGETLTPLLRSATAKLEREAIFWHYPHYGNQGGTPGSSVRMGDYKLIEFFEDHRVELYNLKKDIEEQNDLSQQMPALRDQLRDILHKWQKKVEAKFPLPNPEFQQPI